MARTKRVSKARKGRRVQSKRMGKKRTKRSSKSSSRSNKRMRRSFIKKSRGRSRRSIRRMRGGMFEHVHRDYSRGLDVKMLETVPAVLANQKGVYKKNNGKWEIREDLEATIDDMVKGEDPNIAGSTPVGLYYNPENAYNTQFSELRETFNMALNMERDKDSRASEAQLYERAKSNINYEEARRKYLYPNSK